jgi:hypothetical protein
MRDTAARAQFGCDACGSPAVLPPSVLHDEALVHCSSCGACIGSWQAFKDRAGRAIMAEATAARPHAILSSDPLPNLALSA